MKKKVRQWSARKKVVGLLPPFSKNAIGSCSRFLARVKLFLKKLYLAHLLPLRHRRLLRQYQGVYPVRVAFIASTFASWKVDRVVEAMAASDKFQPVVFLGRLKNNVGDSISDHECVKLTSHFQIKGFNFVDTSNLSNTEIRQHINHFDPHVVFITNPHSLIDPVLHEELLKQRLTCYVPYHHEVVAYGDNREQYDQLSHNAFWKIFAPHQISKECYQKTRMKADKGVVVSGLPACEPFFDLVGQFTYPWKSTSGEKLRVVWAPHWLIKPDLKLATIYELGNAIKELADRYRDKVEWVMRPHPFLKPTLDNHPEWGKDKADEFFRFWEKSDFTQIEEGDYVSLFRTSDAMIHDSGSFLAEYLCVDKPVMYLKTETTSDNYLNEFGSKALSACELGKNIEDIERFIIDLLSGKDSNIEKRKSFIIDQLVPLYTVPPSKIICRVILAEFGVNDESSEELYRCH